MDGVHCIQSFRDVSELSMHFFKREELKIRCRLKLRVRERERERGGGRRERCIIVLRERRILKKLHLMHNLYNNVTYIRSKQVFFCQVMSYCVIVFILLLLEDPLSVVQGPVTKNKSFRNEPTFTNR